MQCLPQHDLQQYTELPDLAGSQAYKILLLRHILGAEEFFSLSLTTFEGLLKRRSHGETSHDEL